MAHQKFLQVFWGIRHLSRNWDRIGIICAFLLGSVSVFAEEVNRAPAFAVGNMDTYEGLETTLFASEPLLANPTNIDIDSRGRVWVVDVMNYRMNEGKRPEGDRILILEDSDGDGSCDKSVVFYQGNDINAAMGIALVGERVIVSCSPNIIVLKDTDGDDRADSKEYLFTQTGERQRDHSAHSFVLGPDGRLYWNFGNTGVAVHDAQGNMVTDLAGNTIEDKGKPYWGGMVFRCELDGSGMETLGHNFRNMFELAVDSFGDMWQSDNDDDGNRAVRINYIMEYGNYGFRDEMTGAGWREPRTGKAAKIPMQHWHQNDPGSIPNFLMTGSGSPTGITVYEGDLLPEIFRGEVIHCDAGPSIVRAYLAIADGAGFEGTVVPLLSGTRDPWFRPVDVCVAPDGSLFVSDWHDPTVGGKRQGDLERGRIFRIAPKGKSYAVPTFDFERVAGAIHALRNPNLSVRFRARQALVKFGNRSMPPLLELTRDGDPRVRARVLWTIAAIEGEVERSIEIASRDTDERVRGMAIKIARRYKLDVIPLVEQLANDGSPSVRRECAIALRGNPSPRVPDLWAILASRFDGQDRWYLEALGIGAEGQWDDCLEAWKIKVGSVKDTEIGREIIWRSRAGDTLKELGLAIADPRMGEDARKRYIRAIDFQRSGSQKDELLLTMLASDDLLAASEGARRLLHYNFEKDRSAKRNMERLIERAIGTPMLLEIAEAYELNGQNQAIVEYALNDLLSAHGVRSIDHVLNTGGEGLLRETLESLETTRAKTMIKAMGMSGNKAGAGILLTIVDKTDCDLELRKESIRALCVSKTNAKLLIQHLKANGISDALEQTASASVSRLPWPGLRKQAARFLPLATEKGWEGSQLPSIADLVSRHGDVARGPDLFEKAGCMACHRVNGKYFDYGPDLSEIGSKLSRDGLFEAIIFPSLAISHGYDGVRIKLKDGNQMLGFIASDTSDSLTVKMAGGISQSIDKSDLLEQVRLEKSLMPEGLASMLTVEELVSLVDYLQTLTIQN